VPFYSCLRVDRDSNKRTEPIFIGLLSVIYILVAFIRRHVELDCNLWPIKGWDYDNDADVTLCAIDYCDFPQRISGSLVKRNNPIVLMTCRTRTDVSYGRLTSRLSL
jgi:hypothetical protein